MRVDVSGQQFVFPTSCACCAGTADAELAVSASKSTGTRVVHTKTNVWSIPYCAPCKGHVRVAERASAVRFALVVCSFIAGVGILFFAPPYFGAVVLVLGLAGAVLAFRRLVDRARSLSSPDCSSVASAVAYLGWQGALHRFDMQPKPFALAFMVANERKLVNVTHEARQLLGASGERQKVTKQKAPRRYVT